MDHSAPRAPTHSEAAFDLYGPAIPDRPVLISVPHAARDYSDDLLAAARVPLSILHRLEDRWADLLVHPLIAQGFTVIVARAPRALIDLNRHEREIDPGMIADLPRDAALHSSAKLRGGLGLFPRRLPGAHELWRGPMRWAEACSRIETLHRPYHAALGQMMAAARDAHGHAILIDIHSMPPLAPTGAGQPAPGVVLGDRFGRSASGRLMTLAADVVASHGLIVAQNHPYAGDHMIDRHGRPDHGLHALQVEIDRVLYLDATLDRPGPGVARMQAVVTRMAQALAAELPRAGYALAAE
ncbi:N-formylglutamate amidohydrolase [Sphingobium sp. AR-3-1]|uniref:N-formylglutamate amidohydrolase n=1 Tax=Sphingobium psychrophilum TaxID=2728834 RepID=A0A7X9WS08_9SPHN|nr:N-formylglutamate amidohydrolase [Sphingobium psychrophilum]NML08802.1 N-formylglutamate amidohydrolase [Sphingobium psychrophilum]